MKNIADMATAEMVAEYNALTGKSIKKFSSRATGEKQLAAARSVNQTQALAIQTGVTKVTAKKNPAPAWPFGNKPEEKKANAWDSLSWTEKLALWHKEQRCPHCGSSSDDVTMAGKDDNHGFCHACGTEFVAETGKAYNKPKNSDERARAIAESWKNDKVAEKRTTRHGVSVEDKGVFRSTKEAFEKLRLPMSRHIKFRLELKAAGKAEFNGLKFKLVEQAKI